MISNISSSLFNLGIILIVFSAIVYVVKTKLTEMDKKINSLSKIVESMAQILNNIPSATTNASPAPQTHIFTKPVVSDDEEESEDDNEDDEEDDEEHDEEDNEEEDAEDSDEEENKNNDIKSNINDIDEDSNDVNTENAVKENDTDKTDSIPEVSELLPSLSNNMEEVKTVELKNLNQTGSDIRSYLEAELEIPQDTRNISIKKDGDDTTLLSELEVNIQPNLDEKVDLNTLNVKELKKMVSKKGGKVSDKKKEDLIEYLLNNE